MNELVFHPLVAGATLKGDWFGGRVPDNVVAGPGSVIDSSFCFKHYYAKGPVGLRVGRNVTIWRTSLAAEENAIIEIGDCSYLTNASVVCSLRITIGCHVMIAGGSPSRTPTSTRCPSPSASPTPSPCPPSATASGGPRSGPVRW